MEGQSASVRTAQIERIARSLVALDSSRAVRQDPHPRIGGVPSIRLYIPRVICSQSQCALNLLFL